MNTDLAALPDETALRVLAAIVGDHTVEQPKFAGLPASLREELESIVGVNQAASSITTEGDLARSALLLLAEDPEIAQRIQALAQSPAQTFSLSGVIVVMGLAIAVLQIKGRLSYDRKKGFQLKLEKEAASDSVLKTFIEKLLSFSSRRTV